MLHLGFYFENRHLHLRNTRNTSPSAKSGPCSVSPELSFPYATFVAVQLLNHVQLFEISWPYGLNYPGLPCPSPSPRVCSNSCPLSQWCHPTISSSVTLFSFCPQIFSLIRGKSIPLLHGLCWDVCCHGTMPLFAKPSCVANSTDLSVQGLIQSDKGSFFTYIEVQENPMSKPFQ